MKVFKMNDFDWVCAETKDEAIKFYQSIDSDYDEIKISEMIECDIESDCIWYPFDIDSDDGKKIKEMFDFSKRQKYKIGKDETGSFDSAIRIPFKYVIKLDIESGHQKPPYIIGSTEF